MPGIRNGTGPFLHRLVIDVSGLPLVRQFLRGDLFLFESFLIEIGYALALLILVQVRG